MRKHMLQTGKGLALILTLTLAVPAAVRAETDPAEGPETITVTLEEGELTIANETSLTVTGEETAAETAGDRKETPEKEEGGAGEETAAGTEAEAAEPAKALVLTGEDGKEHIFEKTEAETWSDAVLTEEYGFFYITYKDADGEEREALETAPERKLEEPVTVYGTTRVNLREKPTSESESLKVITLGEEWTLIGAVPGWLKVENGELTGYVAHKYLTEDKEKVDALLEEQARAEAEAAAAAAAAQAQAEEEAWAQAQAEAEAAAQAAAAQAAQQAAQQQAAAQQVYEVSRQAYDDCDGSGHGYYEITYSDGSVAYEEY